jgi:hypothetical protein
MPLLLDIVASLAHRTPSIRASRRTNALCLSAARTANNACAIVASRAAAAYVRRPRRGGRLAPAAPRQSRAVGRHSFWRSNVAHDAHDQGHSSRRILVVARRESRLVLLAALRGLHLDSLLGDDGTRLDRGMDIRASSDALVCIRSDEQQSRAPLSVMIAAACKALSMPLATFTPACQGPCPPSAAISGCLTPQSELPRFSGVSEDWFDLEYQERSSVASTEEVPR